MTVLAGDCDNNLKNLIESKGQTFDIKAGQCMAIETRNEDTVKRAQKMGFILVIKKDPNLGNIRIKVRPDADLTLEDLNKKIQELDHKGTWFFHGSKKMLINGSNKQRNHVPSPLSLEEVVTLIKELYA